MKMAEGLMTGSSPPPEARIHAERVRHLGRQMPLVLGANMLVAPFVALVMSGSLGRSGAVGWCLALEVLSILRWLVFLRLRAETERSPQVIDRQSRAFVLGSMASGILWGLMGGITIWVNDGIDPLLALMFICGMVSGAIGSLSTLPMVYAAFSIPAVLPVILLYMLRMNPQDVTYAFASVIYLCVNLGYAFSFSRTLKTSIALRFENADLIARLEEARGRAEAESMQKSRFLQSASHDLRQPLHAVSLTLTDLSEQIPEPLRPKLDQGLQSVQSLAELLDRLLEASLAGSGQMVAKREPVELATLFATLEFETASEAASRGLRISFNHGDVWVETDGLILTQILRNHLSNALRHARSRILVAVRKRQGNARIEVWDDGPGIPADQHEAIYEAFYQIGNRERDPSRGRGLGLAIVAGMASVLEARRGLCSRPGSGSVFHLTQPISEPRTIPATDLSSHAPDLSAALPEKVLVIEDDPTLRTVTGELLTRWGVAATLAPDGETAIALVRDGFVPDAIISDLRLSGNLTGIDAIKLVRLEAGPKTPALIVTGAADTVPEAARMGIALMKKPVVPGRLKAWLQTARR